jgi:hypothetical protein
VAGRPGQQVPRGGEVNGNINVLKKAINVSLQRTLNY